MQQYTNPFRSFWMGGYECADHLNAFGLRTNLLQVTGHLEFLEEDYQALKTVNIQTVREGICWSDVERVPYQYDWSSVDERIRVAAQTGIQVVWDICHFGCPDDLTPLHPMFARRFAHLCRAFAEHYRRLVPQGELIITPINEVSFLSWLGGDVRGTVPYTFNGGWDVKYHLMKAYIEGVEQLLQVDPSIRILTTEPLIHVLPHNRHDDASVHEAMRIHQDQFQVLHILAGTMCPELRGKPEYLDILGFNYYYNNQWIHGAEREFLPWIPDALHPEWRSLHSLLEDAYRLFKRPMVLTETSHWGPQRVEWIQMIASEVVAIQQAGIPFWGVCLYPVLDRPDWDFLDHWHRSGLWDIPDAITKERVLYEPAAEALREAQLQTEQQVLTTAHHF
jgi:hypothetical protein